MRDALAGLVLLAICCFVRAAAVQGNVTLETITIFRTHEWLGKKPSLYFRCGDESKVELPDVKEKDRVYNFLGHESWQPLTEFNENGEKCKRCGLYEKNEVLKDGVFDEWEFCPDGFDKAGRYVHFKEGEFNATFLSSEAQEPSDSSNETKQPTRSTSGHRGAVTAMVVVFSLLAVSGVGIILYAKWQQRKRREQQARFMKLFEDDDDFDMEMGL